MHLLDLQQIVYCVGLLRERTALDKVVFSTCKTPSGMSRICAFQTLQDGVLNRKGGFTCAKERHYSFWSSPALDVTLT